MSTRLSRSVRPPRDHQTMWCALANAVEPHPGNRQPRSRCRSCRIMAADGSRLVRPNATASPASFSATTWTRASHASRWSASGGITAPCSVSDVAPPRERLERRMDHHGRPIGVGVAGDALGTQRQQGVGAASFDEGPIVLGGHDAGSDRRLAGAPSRPPLPAPTACAPRGRTGGRRLRTSSARTDRARTPPSRREPP